MNAVQPVLTGKFASSTSMGENVSDQYAKLPALETRKESKLTLKQAEGRA